MAERFTDLTEARAALLTVIRRGLLEQPAAALQAMQSALAAQTAQSAQIFEALRDALTLPTMPSLEMPTGLVKLFAEITDPLRSIRQTVEETLRQAAELSKTVERLERFIRKMGSDPTRKPWLDMPIEAILLLEDIADELEAEGLRLQIQRIPKGKKRGPKYKASEEDRRRIVTAAAQEDIPRHIVAETHGITLKTLRKWEKELRATLKNDDFPK